MNLHVNVLCLMAACRLSFINDGIFFIWMGLVPIWWLNQTTLIHLKCCFVHVWPSTLFSRVLQSYSTLLHNPHCEAAPAGEGCHSTSSNLPACQDLSNDAKHTMCRQRTFLGGDPHIGVLSHLIYERQHQTNSWLPGSTPISRIRHKQQDKMNLLEVVALMKLWELQKAFCGIQG